MKLTPSWRRSLRSGCGRDGARVRVVPRDVVHGHCGRGIPALGARVTDAQAREIAERFWQRDPLAFLGVCAECAKRGETLIEHIKQKAAQLAEARR
jgi:hypothetical protein